MTINDEIQKLVLEYKTEPSAGLLESISSNISAYLKSSPLTRMKNLDEDEMQELLIKLFVRKEDDRPCELERSLEQYNQDFIGRNDLPVSFMSYFKRKISQRTLDICRKRDTYTARNETRRSAKKYLVVTSEPETLESTCDSGEDLSSDVIRDILHREVKEYFFKAVDRIKNPKYREPYLFSILFADHLKYEELGALFDIPRNSINSNMKRAAEQFTTHFRDVLRESGSISPEDFRHGLAALMDNVRTTLDSKSLTDKKNSSIIRERFIQKTPPEEICVSFGINREELREIERGVAIDFLNSLEEVRLLRNAGTVMAEGDQTMGFYDTFMEYLGDAPDSGISRGSAPLEGDILECHEILKMAFPTGRQNEQSRLRDTVRGLSVEEVNAVTEATALSPADISAAIDNPDAYATQYNLLVNHLGLRQN